MSVKESTSGGHCGDSACCGHETAEEVSKSTQVLSNKALQIGERVARSERTIFDVAELCCQSEVALIEEGLRHVRGVEDYAVNIAAGTLVLYHDGSRGRDQEVVERLAKVGLAATPRRSLGRAVATERTFFSAHLKVILVGIALTVLGAILRYVFGLAMASTVVFVAAIVVGGYFVYRQAFTALRARKLNIAVLVTLAVVGAGIIGEWFEAATVIILFAFAEWLEAQSMARARREIGALMELAPPKAEKVLNDGAVVEVDVVAVAVGDRLRLRPGGRVPVDAVIESGRSEIDESTITGEPVPVLKSAGHRLFSGTVNGAGALTVVAAQPASKSTLARIIDAIEDARANQSPTEQFIDRFARVYTPAVVAAAVLVAILPPMLTGAAWLEWFYRALVFLVIACPCALVISTPIANVAGLARAAREGVLVKGGKFLEILGQIRAIAFDKTGTMTGGRLELARLQPFGGSDEATLLRLAARVESESEHHIGRAIVFAARQRSGAAITEDSDAKLQEISAVVGQGIEARLDAKTLRVGNRGWLIDCGVAISDEALKAWEEMEASGQTVVAAAEDLNLVGLIGLRDRPRPQARQALRSLEAMGIEHHYLLTGDNIVAAKMVGAEVGIEESAIYGRLSPQEKVARVEELRARHGVIAMVGDGVNDAPALAAATVGIAMGAAGTDVALESADVALMGDDLSRLPRAVAIGRMARRIILQNVVIALGFKAIFLGLAIAGVATLWMAIVADMGASLIVIFNAIRLLRGEASRGPRDEGIHFAPHPPMADMAH